MKPFHTILIGADFSEGSLDAFLAACSLAVPGQARLHVLHVIEPRRVPEEPVPCGQTVVSYYDATGDDQRCEALRTRMREVYAPDRPVDAEYHVRQGDAASEILKMADELHPDLMAVGTHGRTGLSWLLAGSVATSLVRRATCPVMAYHRPEGHRPAEGIEVILHPTDFSPGCEHSLRAARMLARDLGARLVLLHVVPYGFYTSDMTVPIDPGVYKEALAEERQLVDGPDLKYPVETRLARGDAGEEILHTAAEFERAMIVMGTHGRTGLSRFLMGSVTEYVITRANCPVLALKAPRGHEAPAANAPAESVAMAH